MGVTNIIWQRVPRRWCGVALGGPTGDCSGWQRCDGLLQRNQDRRNVFMDRRSGPHRVPGNLFPAREMYFLGINIPKINSLGSHINNITMIKKSIHRSNKPPRRCSGTSPNEALVLSMLSSIEMLQIYYTAYRPNFLPKSITHVYP